MFYNHRLDRKNCVLNQRFCIGKFFWHIHLWMTVTFEFLVIKLTSWRISIWLHIDNTFVQSYLNSNYVNSGLNAGIENRWYHIDNFHFFLLWESMSGCSMQAFFYIGRLAKMGKLQSHNGIILVFTQDHFLMCSNVTNIFVHLIKSKHFYVATQSVHAKVNRLIRMITGDGWDKNLHEKNQNKTA